MTDPRSSAGAMRLPRYAAVLEGVHPLLESPEYRSTGRRAP